MGGCAIRPVADADAAAICAIYAPIVAATAISFETDPPGVEEMRERIARLSKVWPWLVATAGDIVLGYAYASRHRERAAYRFAADVSAYVAQGARGRGVGRALYSALLALLRAQGYYRAFAGIALPNAASVALHESVGFTPIGVYERAGFKLGAWHDVGWWSCTLRDASTPDAEPVPFSAVSPASVAATIAAASGGDARV
jgi:L-amino acid N-acyltransferase YncA